VARRAYAVVTSVCVRNGKMVFSDDEASLLAEIGLFFFRGTRFGAFERK
jgi:hypothetical protein